MLSSH